MKLKFSFWVTIIIILVHWAQYTSIIRSSLKVPKTDAKSESLMNTFKRPMTFIVSQHNCYRNTKTVVVSSLDNSVSVKVHFRNSYNSYCAL